MGGKTSIVNYGYISTKLLRIKTKACGCSILATLLINTNKVNFIVHSCTHFLFRSFKFTKDINDIIPSFANSSNKRLLFANLIFTPLIMPWVNPMAFFHIKTALKGVENSMFFHPQSAERTLPIGFSPPG